MTDAIRGIIHRNGFRVTAERTTLEDYGCVYVVQCDYRSGYDIDNDLGSLTDDLDREGIEILSSDVFSTGRNYTLSLSVFFKLGNGAEDNHYRPRDRHRIESHQPYQIHTLDELDPPISHRHDRVYENTRKHTTRVNRKTDRGGGGGSSCSTFVFYQLLCLFIGVMAVVVVYSVYAAVKKTLEGGVHK